MAETKETAPRPGADEPRPIDLHEFGEFLNERQKHYEKKLKNGGKNLEELSRGVSALLAGQIQFSKEMKQLATRVEVREMIESHATTCALARPKDSPGAFEIGRGGIKATGYAAIRTAYIAILAIAVFLAFVAPTLPQIITAWKGKPAQQAQQERPADENRNTAPVKQ